VRPGFLDEAALAGILAAVEQSKLNRATIHRKGVEFVEEKIRRTRVAQVPEEVAAPLALQLRGLRPVLAEHFQMPLEDCEDPQFLVYDPGDQYKEHRDANPRPDAAPGIKARKVSVVVFLNRQTDEPAAGCFGGGSLVFFGILPDEKLAAVGLPLVPEPGLLVAFRSSILHRVPPVTHGRRYSVVTWFR
jgi:SM-20-related protein